MLDLIERHAIDCDLRLTGHLVGAVDALRPAPISKQRPSAWPSVMDFHDVEILSAAQARASWWTRPITARSYDKLGGHMHPLNYTLGLARAAAAAGVTIHENSVALRLEPEPTASGSPRPRARSGPGMPCWPATPCSHGLEPRVNSRIMPVGNYIVATEPLHDASAIIPSNAAVSDTRFVVNYYRLSADGRLLFGGGERYTPSPPADIAGLRAAASGKDLPADQGPPHRSCLGRAGLGDDVAAAACRPLSARSISRTAIPARASSCRRCPASCSPKRSQATTSRFDLFAFDEPAAVPGRHGAARPALCARHALVRHARPG